MVITGLGVISPVGNDVRSTWDALLAGQNGCTRITHFDATEDYATRIACEVKGFDPSTFLDPKEARRFDRFSKFALGAAGQAMRHAGLDGPGDVPSERFGVIFGSGLKHPSPGAVSPGHAGFSLSEPRERIETRRGRPCSCPRGRRFSRCKPREQVETTARFGQRYTTNHVSR